MDPLLKKFITRAPRYVLRPNDNHLMRYAQDLSQTAFTTRLLNLSNTGLAFVVARNSIPQVGDTLKVEFQVPGGEPIAWWAKVARVEPYTSEKWWLRSDPYMHDEHVLVAAEFENLPLGHVENLKSGLYRAFFEAVRDIQRERLKALFAMAKGKAKPLFFYVLITLAAAYFLYAISRPDANYNSKRGAPWGQRFHWGSLSPSTDPDKNP